METVTPEEMRQIEEDSERLGIPRLLLMENAGHSIAERIKERFGDLVGKRVVVVAGTGNNGGDGFVAARHLTSYKADITVVLLGEPRSIRTEEASSNWRALEKMHKSVKLAVARDEGSLEALEHQIAHAEIIVDAIFGTGVKGRIGEPHSKAIDLINSSRAYKVAVDIPSGLDPLTGEVHDRAIKADLTITFHRMKPGLLGRQSITGDILVEPIGIPPEAESFDG